MKKHQTNAFTYKNNENKQKKMSNNCKMKKMKLKKQTQKF